MSASRHDLAHLASLIDAARAHAAGLGVECGETVRLLEEALSRVRALEGRGGQADQGLRPQQLTTEND
ncbi:MAG: hypothetical protein JWR08_2006 [Enterovirga sp.]|jgi:hypothetical protein|nr:hypothetical protein [Enterovirga sp.]